MVAYAKNRTRNRKMSMTMDMNMNTYIDMDMNMDPDIEICHSTDNSQIYKRQPFPFTWDCDDWIGDRTGSTALTVTTNIGGLTGQDDILSCLFSV